MKKYMFVFMLVLFVGLGSGLHTVEAKEIDLKSTLSIQITVIEEGHEYIWKFRSPKHYEYVDGEDVIKKKAAKKKVGEMLGIIELQEDSDIQDLVERVKESAHPNVERLDIRYINKEDRLITWVWQKDA